MTNVPIIFLLGSIRRAGYDINAHFANTFDQVK